MGEEPHESTNRQGRAPIFTTAVGITLSMATPPTTQDDWTVHALNIHGVFFERRCTAAVSATTGWTLVSTNYPVEYPPPNGPWRGKESSLDIRAQRAFEDGRVIDVQIECKKANPEFVNWVFFPRAGTSFPAPFRTAASINANNQSGVGPWTSSLVMLDGKIDMLIASDSREVRGDYARHKCNIKTKTANASIQDAAYQVAIANRAIIQEDSDLLAKARSSAQHTISPWSRKTYIPIIVTTARLFHAQFSAEDVDITSGEIQFPAVSLLPVANLLYEYPLPKHLQHSPADPLPALMGAEISSFTRMDIIVVQADSLSGLLSGLS